MRAQNVVVSGRLARRVLAAVLATALASAAAAGCVPPDALAKRGILFRMADGKVWHARAAGKKGVRLDQVNGKAGEDEFIEGPFGVYEVYHGHVVFKGKGRWGYIKRDFRKKPVPPVPGKGWTSRLQEDQQSFRGGGTGPDYAAEAQYRFLPQQEVELGGCSYTVVPVEAIFTGKDENWGGMLDRSDRWLYFPDLGTGVRTMSRNSVSGEEARAGLVAISAAP